MQNKIFGIQFLLSCCLFQGVKANGTAALEQLKQPADAIRRNNRPPVADRLFVSEAIEKKTSPHHKAIEEHQIGMDVCQLSTQYT